MKDKTLFEETDENWPHLLKDYAMEAGLLAKNSKATLPPGTPAFVKQVLEGSMVHKDVKLGERTTAIKSLVCPGCTIGAKTKIVNSAIHNGAVIGDNCSIISCIIGADAKIETGTKLKDQIIGSKKGNEEDENENEDDDDDAND